MNNILCGVTYDGTNYAGWQKQENALGIQEVLENAFLEALNQKVEVVGSGRTDAKVHAICQCFSVKLNFKLAEKLPLAINPFLPSDIKLLWAKEMPSDFHARYSAHKKTYLYKVRVGEIESPFDTNFCAYIKKPLNLEKMLEASKFLLGTHNFMAFCSSGSSVVDFVRTVYSIEIKQTENMYTFEICGNGFLYNMVRIIVGTLVDVGNCKIEPQSVIKIIESENRAMAGKTMPAKGLYLKCVEY